MDRKKKINELQNKIWNRESHETIKALVEANKQMALKQLESCNQETTDLFDNFYIDNLKKGTIVNGL